MSNQTRATLLGGILGRLRELPSGLWRLEASIKGVEFEGKVMFRGRPLISVSPGARLVIGDGVEVNSAVRTNPLACPQPSVLRAMAPGAELILGKCVGLSATVLCAGRRIEIGEGTIMGSGAMIVDNDFHVPEGEFRWGTDCQTMARPVTIGRGVFIGARAIVLKGVTIGDRAVVGAGAVLSRDVPAGGLAVGNPARIVTRKTAAPSESAVS